MGTTEHLNPNKPFYSRAKSFLTTLLFISLLLLGTSISSITAHAAIDLSQAVDIPINAKTADATTQGYRDGHKIYRFTTPTDGYVQLKFESNRQNTTDVVWEVTLRDVNYDAIAGFRVYGSYTETLSFKHGLPAGTYYCQVSSAIFYKAASTDTYYLTPMFTASNVWEKEFNDSYDTATPITTNTEYYGTNRQGWGFEKDYYKFSIADPGHVKLCFHNNQDGTRNKLFEYSIMDENYKIMYQGKGVGNIEDSASAEIGLNPGTYYVMVEGQNVTPNDIQAAYNFRVEYSTGDKWEREHNDDFTSATPIKLGDVFYGSNMAGNTHDPDYYSFDVSSGGYYRITVNTPNEPLNNIYWFGTIYDATYKDISRFEVRGGTTQTIHDVQLSKGSYYILIKGNGNPSSTDTYSFKIEKRNLSKGDMVSIESESATIQYKITGSKTVMLNAIAKGAYDLTKLSVPATVKIDGKAYKVTAIGKEALKGCVNLTSLTIGKNVKSIGKSAFSGCSRLYRITVNTSGLTKKSVKNSLKNSYVRTIKAPKKKVKAYKKIFTKKNTGSKNALIVEKK